MTDTQLTRASTAAELTIATPEGVLFRLPLAGPASRLYAMLRPLPQSVRVRLAEPAM